MDMKILREVLRRKRGSNFDPSSLLEDDKKKAQKGLGGDDLAAEVDVVMGKGPSETEMKDNQSSEAKSSDELAPSNKELAHAGVDGIEPFKNRKKKKGDEVDEIVDGAYDDFLFNETEYEKAKNKDGLTLGERVQLGIGKKMGRM